MWFRKNSYNCLYIYICPWSRWPLCETLPWWYPFIWFEENPCSVMLTQIRISVNAPSVICMIFRASVNPWSVTYPCFVNREYHSIPNKANSQVTCTGQSKQVSNDKCNTYTLLYGNILINNHFDSCTCTALKATRGFAFVTESWVRKFDGQLSACAQIIYDFMESVGAKEITSFIVESWGCKTQYLGVSWGRRRSILPPVKYLFSNGELNMIYQWKAD